MYFSIQAGFAARNEEYPIYDFNSGNFDLKLAKRLKNDVKEFLLEYYKKLSNKAVTEEEHKRLLRALSNKITKKYKAILHGGKFRIGVSQKIINLFLKYLWAAGLIREPHHCPFDNIIKRKIQKYSKDNWLTDWTEMSAMKEYEEYVSATRTASNNESLTIAAWEMKNWKRR